MGHITKKNASDIKNFWIFRIAGMLAGINDIRRQITNENDSSTVITIISFLYDAEDALGSANNLLRKIDYNKIVR